MASLFTKIVNGEIPAHVVAESEDFLAFLDISPLQYGHTLVIPKKEVDYIFDVADDLLGELMKFSKEVAIKIKNAYPCDRIGVTVIGLEVPHAHIHLVPINKMADMNFSGQKLTLDQEELAEIASKIKNS